MLLSALQNAIKLHRAHLYAFLYKSDALFVGFTVALRLRRVR
jgi:hypothetical protein